MRIRHYFDKENQLSEEVKEEAGFLLTNKLGSYLWLTSQPKSRYQGWFFAPPSLVGQNIFKIVENIEPVGLPAVSKLENHFWAVKRTRGRFEESFFLPSYHSGLVYEISAKKDICLVLDIKPSYQNEEEGRVFKFSEKRGIRLVKYEQKGVLGPLFLAVKSDGEKVIEPKEWFLRHYSLDQSRNSPPFSRYVFKAFRFNKTKLIVCAIGQTKEAALKEAEFVFRNLNRLKKTKQRELEQFKPDNRIKNREVRLAQVSSRYALSQLLVLDRTSHKVLGLYGGLPWFFQFWARDEALALRALLTWQNRAGQEVLFKLIKQAREQKTSKPADFWGLLAKRAIAAVEEGALNWFFRREVKKFLIEKSRSYFTAGAPALIRHHPKESWMDSLFRTDSALEIEALALSWLEFLARNTDRKEQAVCKEKAALFKKIIRERFYNGGFLADGFGEANGADFTTRANLFLAAYFAPDLLKKEEWRLCFENVLAELWLDWGGLSTLSQKNPIFQNSHTGENALSYHQGDSWFYLNNLAALVMQESSSHYFAKYINKILTASTKEILWQGIVGFHTELSSAGRFSSEGCLAQAWSSALYLELLSVLFKDEKK